jgi:Tol biopolymer transport system component
MKGGCSAPLALLLAATVWASLSAARPDESRPPANLHVDALLKPFVDRMWQSSPTFRRQCRRLAAEPGLPVTVEREDQPNRASSANARTELTFKANAPVTARVYLKTSSNVPELIAHELEHILEQLDGVDLQAQAGNGAVWKADTATFETRRAIEAGRRVAREIRQANADEFRERETGDAFDLVATLTLHDRGATPMSPRAARISSDGRFVVFVSPEPLVPDDRNQHRDVYVTDLTTGRTTLESVGPRNTPADGDSFSADVSGNGRYVVFESEAGNLTPTPFPAGTAQVFLRDRVQGTTRLLTTNADGRPAEGPSRNPVISANGRLVALESAAGNLVAHTSDQHSGVGIYLIELSTDIRTRIDRANLERMDGAVSSMSPSISADGRYVVFASKADLTCQGLPECADEIADRNHLADVYVYDNQSRATKRISRGHDGAEPDGPSYDPAISGDGRVVAFVSEASNLIRGSKGRLPQIYVFELGSGRTELVSQTPSGGSGNGSSIRPALSFDGALVVFQSLATDLRCERKCRPPLEDINLLWDVFVHDRATTRTARVSGDVGEEWMETSRGPSIDGAGRIVAFGSWHPIDRSDAAYDEDLYLVRIEPARLMSRAPARVR